MAKMYPAIRDVTLLQAGFDSLRQGLAELGVPAVEVAISRNLRVPASENSLEESWEVATPRQAEQVAQRYREAKVAPCALFIANNFNAPDREAEIAWTVAAVRAAEDLGVGVVRLDGAMSGHERLTRGRRADLYREALERVLAATDGSSVLLAIENHGRQGNDLAWLDQVLSDVEVARVGLTLDPANLYGAGYPLSEVYNLVEHLAPRVFHVHVKNIAYPAHMRERHRPRGWEYGCCVCPAHRGDLDYGRIIRLLATAGYQGALALEDESLGKFEPLERAQLLCETVVCLQAEIDQLT